MTNFDEIRDSVGENEILLIEKIGSKLYSINNPKDEDILVVVDEKAQRRSYLNGKDMFIFSREEYKESLLPQFIGEGCIQSMRKLCAFLNHEAAKVNLRGSVYYGECENKKINMFDNKELVFQRVLEFGDKNFFNSRIRNLRGDHGCGRMMSWALWYYYAFENGSLELTKEQQNTIQLCHDGNLPIERAKELRDKIVKLIGA